MFARGCVWCVALCLLVIARVTVWCCLLVCYCCRLRMRVVVCFDIVCYLVLLLVWIVLVCGLWFCVCGRAWLVRFALKLCACVFEFFCGKLLVARCVC